MKLGLVVGYSGRQARASDGCGLEAERLGFDSCWTAEAYGSDAVIAAAWILAQDDARSRSAPRSCSCPRARRRWRR